MFDVIGLSSGLCPQGDSEVRFYEAPRELVFVLDSRLHLAIEEAKLLAQQAVSAHVLTQQAISVHAPARADTASNQRARASTC